MLTPPPPRPGGRGPAAPRDFPEFFCPQGSTTPGKVLAGGSLIVQPPPPRAVLAGTRRHQGFSGIFLAHRNRARAAQPSYVDDIGWCLPVFLAIRDLLGGVFFLGGGGEGR